MRLQRLDLLRYGHFTGLALDLPADEMDLHILYGANEAGKSTALAALEDLLFGIPRSSTLNFLHPYPDMRIGGRLEAAGETLEFRRRKGNRDTLLAADDTPLPGGEAMLAPFLAGADRPFFERMFSLDHGRLRAGGQQIMDAQDEVGQMLFAAGAGIAGLRERLAGLNRQADALWGHRRAARREYAQAEERLRTAEEELRRQVVTAGRWDELRKADAAARRGYAELEERIADAGAEQARLTRIRLVHGHVRRKAELDARIAGLGPALPLPADARQRLDTAEREAARATARAESEAEQLAQAQAAHDALLPDSTLLERAADIRQLAERRIELRGERASLPRGGQFLAPEDLLARIPARPALASLRALLTRRGGLAAEVRAAKVALVEAQAASRQLQQALEAMPEPVETGLLAAQLGAMADAGDTAAALAAAESRLADSALTLRHGLDATAAFAPGQDGQALAGMALPPRVAVLDWRDRRGALAQRQRDNADRRRATAVERDGHRKAATRIMRTEHVVLAEQLLQARRERDAGWQVLRRTHQEGGVLPQTELDAHEASVQATDVLADRRFETAEAAARLAVTDRQIEELEARLAQLDQEDAELAAEAEGLAREWSRLWSALPVPPGSADTMLEWLEGRDAVLTHSLSHDRAAQELAALRHQAAAAGDALLDSLTACGEAAAAYRGQPLRTVRQAALDCLRRHERQAEERARVQAELDKALDGAHRRQEAQAAAEAGWQAWLRDWEPAAKACGLSPGEEPAKVEARLRALEDMREGAILADTLRRDRIGKIERDIAGFEAETAALLADTAPDLSALAAEEGVLALVRRLEAAQEMQARRADRAREAEEAARRLAECRNAAGTAQDAVAELQRLAGATDLAGLKAAIERSEALQAAQAEREEVIAALERNSDGLPLAVLEGECAGIDIDQVIAREQVLKPELEDLQEQLLQARVDRAAAHSAFGAVGGADGAARAAADRQAALAAMEDVAERYLRLRAAALLLEWAIDRYRQEKQAPLLARASGHFALLTRGSFSELALEFDEGDRLHLTGRRPDGARVGIDGMSSGTADQLYLALRVAAVEDYLARAAPLPFVADDLFVNFDDARAEAGFRVLGSLARHCQVLVFTHHRHLVDIARAALGPKTRALSLANGSPL